MKKSRIITALLALLLLMAGVLLLTACGGGTESGSESSKTYTVYCYKSEDGTAAEEIKISSERGNTVAPVKKDHYTFLGYYTAEGTQIFNASGKQVEGLLIDRNVTVYARFEPIEYTVTFVVGEGSFPEGTSTSVKVSAENWQMIAPVPTAPTSTLQFEGWYNKDFTVQYVGEHGTVDYTKFALSQPLSISNKEIKLYAKYDTRTVKVTIDYNDFMTAPKELEVVYGNVLGDLASYRVDNEIEKREIVGFSTSRYEMVPHTGPLTDDITVYAIWKNYKYVTISYDTFDDELFKIYDGGVNGAELPVIRKPGYELDGFYTSPTYSGNPVTYISFQSLANRYYAKLSLAEYTLTFNTLYADVATPSPLTYYYGDTTALPELSRRGFNFLGWSLESDGTGEVIYNVPQDFYGNYTLYAVWDAETYIVELKGNGGSVPNAEEMISFGSDYRLSIPMREGYTFLGWFDGTAGTATRYTNASGASLSAWNRTEGITLYAHWQITTYTVRLNPNGGNIAGTKLWTLEYGSAFELPASYPIRSGLMFDGWYNADYTKEYTGVIRVTENLTLTAKWVESRAISTAADLARIAENPGGTYHLAADINLLAVAWTPIAEFTGTLNGNGHKIYAFSLTLNAGAGDYRVGLFGVNKGTVRNLTVSEMSLNVVQSANNWSNVRVGAIAGENHGDIINCHVVTSTLKGTFTANDVQNGTYTQTVCFGSIVGLHAAGNVISCTSSSPITADMTMAYNNVYRPKTTADLRVGGIVGLCSSGATVSYSAYSGEISATHVVSGKGNQAYAYGSGAVGGIAAYNEGSCVANLFSGTVYIGQAYNATGNYNNGPHTTIDIGGIAAVNSGTMNECASTGTVHAQGPRVRVGGLAAANESEIKNCYSSATVAARAGVLHTYVGGAVAQNKGSIRMTYSTGSIAAEYVHYAGGFVGENTATGTIAYCYTATDIALTAGNENCAFFDTNAGTITSSACAADITYVAAGANVTVVGRHLGITVKNTEAELYAADYLLNTLYFDTLSFKITGEAHPKLFFEK